MDTGRLRELVEAVSLVFPAEWVKSALVLAWFAALVVVGVFVYLNRFAKRAHLSLWIVAWMYYAVYLAASIGLEDAPGTVSLDMMRTASIGISALFLLWGSFRLTKRTRTRRELWMAMVAILLWSCADSWQARERSWLTLPMFALLAAASVYTGLLYRQMSQRYHAAKMLSTGFLLWGLHLLALPFLGVWPTVTVTAYFVSALLALFISLGMIMQVLEQARERTDALLDEFKKGVAKRRLLEQEITVTAEKYRALFEAAGDAIFLVDLESFCVLECNQAAQELVRCDGRGLTGRDFRGLCPGLRCDSDGIFERVKGFSEIFRPAVEFQIMRADGTPVACEGDSNFVQCTHQPVLQLNVREITERKHIEQQTRQTEKLAGLGRLIAGVAHELNNRLAVIMGYAQILARQDCARADGKVRDDVQKILHESAHTAAVVRNLLAFARPREPQMAVVDINQLIIQFLETHTSSLDNSSVRAEARLEPYLPRVRADLHQIEQVLANLVTNAVQALADHKGRRTLTVSTEQRGAFVRVVVADTGPGIAPDLLPKIFEPFFTTKATGQGTGLGLSVCHSIVEEHQGKIWVQSAPNQPTRFIVELPTVPCDDATAATEPAALTNASAEGHLA